MKRAEGNWALGHRAVVEALRQADLVVGLNPADREGVEPFVASTAYRALLRPSLTRAPMPRRRCGRRVPLRLVTVAMMRPGDKLASYRVLGAALAGLLDLEWTLEVIGDGPARGEVEATLGPLGSRVRFIGALRAKPKWRRGSLPPISSSGRRSTRLSAWQSSKPKPAALPSSPGTVEASATVVADGETGLLTVPGDVGAFAAAVRQLIEDPARCAALGEAARSKAVREHDLASVAQRLAAMLATLRSDRAA